MHDILYTGTLLHTVLYFIEKRSKDTNTHYCNNETYVSVKECLWFK